MQRFNTSKLVAAIQRDWPKPSSSSTLCVCVIFFIDLDHQNHLQCQYPQIRNNQSSGSKSDQAESLTPVQVGDLQPKQHYLGDHMILLEKINKIYIIFLIRTHWGWKYSKDMSSIKFRNKGWKRTIWSWSFSSSVHQLMIQICKYTNTQIHKYTNTNTQIHKYKYNMCGLSKRASGFKGIQLG